MGEERRTRVARLFPSEAACMRLVSAVLMERSEDWQIAERRYVVFTDQRAIEGWSNLQKRCCSIVWHRVAIHRKVFGLLATH
ncbi:MAG: hypothetical protein EHM68_18170 [Lysobacterales bacterium]|nr:MAG: hypothetical protein EHM68_18170 [Xanthomonadales bacterium]